jgi:hypothetical protein
MNEKILELITVRLDTLGVKIGVVGEQLWYVLIKQVRIEGWAYLGATGLLLLLVLILSLLAWSARKDRGDDTICCSILGLFIFACMLGTSYCGLARVFNPEFYALQEILRVFGK